MSADATREMWAKLTAPLPPEALKPLKAAEQRGLTGMSDIAEWALWDRLYESGLPWEFVIEKTEVVAMGVQVEKKIRDRAGNVTGTRMASEYVVGAQAILIVDGRRFAGGGAHQDEDYDWAVKGAITSAFKTCSKWAGISMSVWKGGPAQNRPVQATAPNVIFREAQGPARPAAAPVSDLGLCPRCGSAAKFVPAGTSKAGKAYDEFVGCSKFECKWIRKDSEPAVRQVDPVTAGVRNPSAPVVSASSHPSRNGGRDDDDAYWNTGLGADGK